MAGNQSGKTYNTLVNAKSLKFFKTVEKKLRFVWLP